MQKFVLLMALLAASTPAYADSILGDTVNIKGRGSAPASPAAGRYRLYFDTATHALKWKNSAGTVFTASTGGGGSVDGLKAAYEAASTSSQNILAMSTTLGSFRLRDNATPITGEEIFAVENSTGSSIYFSAFVNGVYIGKPLTIDADVTLSAGVDINGSSTSDITGRWHLSSGSAPACSVNTTVNGTGGSCAVTGNAQAGKVTVTGGTGGGFVADTTWFTLTHANSYACTNGTAVQFTNADTDAGAATNNYNVNSGFYATSTTTAASFKTTSTYASHPANGTAYEFWYRLDCY